MSTKKSPRRIARGLAAKLMVCLAALSAIAWLGGGSCTINYRSEDCDPCLNQCKCNTVCQHTHATFAATHALTDFVLIEHASDGVMSQRTFSEIVGLSVERAGGPAWPGDDDIVRFARGVLAVNPSHLALRDASLDFVLDSVVRYETAVVVQLHQATASGRDNLVSLLFDPRGNLIEIDQAHSN